MANRFKICMRVRLHADRRPGFSTFLGRSTLLAEYADWFSWTLSYYRWKLALSLYSCEKLYIRQNTFCKMFSKALKWKIWALHATVIEEKAVQSLISDNLVKRDCSGSPVHTLYAQSWSITFAFSLPCLSANVILVLSPARHHHAKLPDGTDVGLEDGISYLFC